MSHSSPTAKIVRLRRNFQTAKPNWPFSASPGARLPLLGDRLPVSLKDKKNSIFRISSFSSYLSFYVFFTSNMIKTTSKHL
jgi:hypothetical protein